MSGFFDYKTPEVFDKETREQAANGLATIFGTVPELTLDYIKALEEVAKTARTAWKDGFVLSSAQEAALYDSLSKVDWMEE